ncbi:chaperonin 10-like protein [Delphinella strobiligena]|nr:chaperonin 10-like protein [Delphinella strobiligena]
MSTIAAKSIKALAPLLDRVLVQRIKAETKTAGGIFLPESSVKELNEAKVLAVGPGGLDREGKRVAVSVQPGDKVLIPSVSFLILFCFWREDGKGEWRGRWR